MGQGEVGTMTTALDTIAEQLQELQELRGKVSALDHREAELEAREAAVAKAAEQPWGSLAVMRAEQIGVLRGRQEAIVLIDQQLEWLRPGVATTVLLTLREHIKRL